MKGLQLNSYGNAADVVTLVDVPDVGAPGPDEVVIDVLASSVEPTDLFLIAGQYGFQPQLPHLLGAQGVGRVSAVGSEVTHLMVGDITIVPPLSNAWVNQVKTNAPFLRPLPEGDINQLAQLGINPPAAYLLLTDFVDVARGQWVIQNAANSGVGRSVIAVARHLGIRTVNIVRREELVSELKAVGADVVLVDGPDLPARIKEATGGAAISLAFDGVGGDATQAVLDALAPHGKVVVYSGMSGRPAQVNGAKLVFTGKQVIGFWLVDWFQSQKNYDRVTAIYEELAPLVATGAIRFPIAGEFTLDQYADAITLAGRYSGKVIFKPNGR